ncbi:MAG: hypothetical protein U1E42_09755 [Rhodospirillales bacterium]
MCRRYYAAETAPGTLACDGCGAELSPADGPLFCECCRGDGTTDLDTAPSRAGDDMAGAPWWAALPLDKILAWKKRGPSRPLPKSWLGRAAALWFGDEWQPAAEAIAAALFKAVHPHLAAVLVRSWAADHVIPRPDSRLVDEVIDKAAAGEAARRGGRS